LTVEHFIFGNGPARAIVLHGWFADSREFEHMLPALDPSKFTLAFMDFRGYGNARASKGPFNMSTVAEDVEALANSLKWSDFSLVGHSMGAKAALRTAVNLKSRVARILALTPVWAGAASFDAGTLALFRGAAKDLASREAILTHSTGGRLPKTWIRWLAQTSSEACREETFEAYFHSWAMEDFATEVQGLPHQILAVAGENDNGIPAEAIAATWIKNLPNARLEILPTCGHYPMLETPIALASIFERFLAS